MDPPTKINTKNLLIKIQSDTKKVYTPHEMLKTPPAKKFGKTSWTLFLDFQTMCIDGNCAQQIIEKHNSVNKKKKVKF